MADEYSMVTSGKLSLKNGVSLFGGTRKKDKKEKKDKKKKKDKRSRTGKTKGDEDDALLLDRHVGMGRIVTSGTTVTGHGTSFNTQFSAGDAIGVLHPVSEKEELKLVQFVLGKTSISISSPFSTDISDGIEFFYLQQRKTQVDVEIEKSKSKKQKLQAEEAATGVGTAQQQQIQRVEAGMSREELLDLRSGKKSDRRC